MTAFPTYAVSTPPCFGKEWDPKEVDCAGGFNAAYTGPNGTKVQPRCNFFQACQGRVTLDKLGTIQRGGTVIPPETLLRAQHLAAQMPIEATPQQETPTPAPRGPLPQAYAAPQQYAPPQTQPRFTQPQPPMQYPPHYATHGSYQQYAGPAHEAVRPSRDSLVPSPAVPPYLATQEKRKKGESRMSPLGREMFRAGMKAMGQTFANYWDYIPLGDDE